MHLHEFQAKQLLSRYDIPIPAGRAAASVQEALQSAKELGGDSWVVKAQVHAGGRGKAGGVRWASNLAEVQDIARTLLGSRLMTPQARPKGVPVDTVLVERSVSIGRELYCALTVDYSRERVVAMVSRSGGVDIEEIAAQDPLQIETLTVRPVMGLRPYQGREMAFALGLEGGQVAQFTELVLNLYRLLLDQDASLVELNPLVATLDSGLVALDAKLVLDDNALYRHSDSAALRDTRQEDPRESLARQYGLNYVTLEGNIACMVNGAGLAMATMDLIKLHGGEPANFLDVGGGTTADRVAEAFKLILSDPNIKAILINIFGGIVRCDLMAEGIAKAVSEVKMTLPVVIRLEGNQAERARELLSAHPLQLITASDLTDAAQKAVAAAG